MPIYNGKISKLSPDLRGFTDFGAYFRFSMFSAVLISINEAP